MSSLTLDALNESKVSMDQSRKQHTQCTVGSQQQIRWQSL